ncbi:alpha/beta fold hydrolase [Cypionkella sinensis]|uniref:Alpha/beta fold hydrolase n=1 Tax=Cypionkella sinensis TaxID=1756043 RepID=A0ABV7J823_9RHOB
MKPSSLFVPCGDLTLHVETFGQADRPAVLLIMGNSAPGLVWPDAFCAGLAETGFRVIRFDQRDTGLSSHVDYESAPYDLADLAAEGLAVLDALAIQHAHVVGLSQGGSVACRIALAAPGRVASLALLMSSLRLGPKNRAFAGLDPEPGALPQPAAAYVAEVIALNAVAPQGAADIARSFVENFRLAKGPASPFDEAFWADLGAQVAAIPEQRGDGQVARMANSSNHRKAQMATAELTEAELEAIGIPTLVLHGDGDPIFPMAHADWTARALGAARVEVIADMGHALDPAFFAPILSRLTAHFAT